MWYLNAVPQLRNLRCALTESKNILRKLCFRIEKIKLRILRCAFNSLNNCCAALLVLCYSCPPMKLKVLQWLLKSSGDVLFSGQAYRAARNIQSRFATPLLTGIENPYSN